ncbi:MAG TPA: hypothetical protein VFX48_05555, partial [Saprospiraceae bacterium]|nr:hypothetical protein [Saprospiraceae bacterium]
TQVYLGFEIPASANTYFLTTNTENNELVLGTKSPKLYRSDQQFYYPFFIQDLLRIFSSDKGDSYFYYFYDWVVRKKDELCFSARVELPVVVLPVRTETGQAGVRLFWMNQGRTLQLETTNNEEWNLEIFSPDGRFILEHRGLRSGQPVELPYGIPGFYLLQLRSAKGDKREMIKWLISG